MNTQKVIIAGAGPGDPELISLKALRAIEFADVILYDALIDTSLLDHAKAGCVLIYVGKRKGHHELAQDRINELLVFYAARFQTVLRLKGGDPFVFGRGHEEYSYIKERGYNVELIPGISSALAGPMSIGIPLTKRGVNESFWVITGMLSSGRFSDDLKSAAQSSATVVVLMGMTHLKAISELFTQYRSAFEPAAIIQNGTFKNQRAVCGTVGSILSLSDDHGLSSPAVIVIGKVVSECSINQILNLEEVKMNVAV